jgi:hypothetical protein
MRQLFPGGECSGSDVRRGPMDIQGLCNRQDGQDVVQVETAEPRESREVTAVRRDDDVMTAR